MRLLPLLLGLGAASAALAQRPSIDELDNDDVDPFEDDSDDFDDGDTGYGKRPAGTIKTTGGNKVLPEGVEPGTILFEVCTSWGYKARFMEYRRIVLRHYPGVPIVGRQYPPGDDKIMIATAGQYMFFFGIAFVFMGDTIFKAMGLAQPPDWYNAVKDNKMQACMFLWVLNSVAAGQIATHAFEVSFDGNPIFSKLETGRFPSPDELLQALAANGVQPRGNAF